MFGAAVHARGRASPTLARRIDLAAEAAARYPDALLFLSGAVGRHPPSEAAVMAASLAGRVDHDRLILDEESRDTLQTVRAASAFAREQGVTRCIVCTDRYHQPRARMLFGLFGLPSEGIWFARPRPPTPLRYRWYMRLREARRAAVRSRRRPRRRHASKAASAVKSPATAATPNAVRRSA